MQAVANLLTELGWHKLPDCDGEYVKPVFGFRDWKCMVGQLWTTVWRHDGAYIQELDSVKTEDRELVEHRLHAVMKPPSKPASGRRSK